MRNLVIPVRNLAVFVVLLLAGVSAAIAQTSISGTVKDLQGEPLIGVSVVEKGHQNMHSSICAGKGRTWASR